MMRIQTIPTSITLLMVAVVLAAPLVTNAVLAAIRPPEVVASHDAPEHPHGIVHPISAN